MALNLTIEDIVKKFENAYPVKALYIPLVQTDGKIVTTTHYVIDEERAAQIRSSMTAEEIANQRIIM